MGARITHTDQMRAGCVALVAVELVDRETKAPYWWRRFVYVTAVLGPNHFEGVTLKLNLDYDRDWRDIDIRKDVVEIVENDRLPAGVSAILMKHFAKGTFKLPGGD